MRLIFAALVGCLVLANRVDADDAPPRSLDPRLTIELFAEHPQVRTPTGIDVDADGRVWVIESNTHFRPDGYDGHPTDRLLILTDTDGDGRCDDVQTFADGFTFAMSVAVRPVWMDPIELMNMEVAAVDGGDPQQVVLCTRHDIFLLEDHNRDDVCDLQTPLIHLETENRYPHNGLAGLAFDAEGWMYFGIGQNHGQPYRMISHEAVQRQVAAVNSLSPAERIQSRSDGASGGEGWGEGDGGDAQILAPHPGPLPHIETQTATRTHSVGERELLQVFLATRKEVLLLEDTDGDDVCDRRTTLAHLDTAGNYPHNGLAGLAFDPAGWMYFGFGENLGEDYRLVSLEGDAADANDAANEVGIITGGGEGGSLFRMRPDGTGLTRWSTGYWNPHASCTDAFGRLFTVDNDPDSRPPCRLIHVIEGGDSGYRFRNGRKGLHPFTAWNGELLGTQPMVAGTGEAPSGLVACEHAAWPSDMQGNLLVGSWGDHRIDRFQLRPAGGSFESIPEPLIIGGENFRPVGVALAEDGSLYCSDWVLKDYNLHGQGRVWRIRPVVDPNDTSADEPTLDDLAGTTDRSVLERGLLSAFLPARRLAARKLVESAPDALVNLVRDTSASERSRYEALSALALNPNDNRTRIIKDYVPAETAPFDSVQTLLAMHFEEGPSVTRLLELIDAPVTDSASDDDVVVPPVYGAAGSEAMTDPQFILAGMEQLTPLLRVLGASQTESAVTMLNRVAGAGDPFVDSRLVMLLARTLNEDQFDQTLRSDAGLSPRLTTLVLLGARQAFPKSTRCAEAALNANHVEVLRAAVQWVAEERLDSLRPNVEAALASDLTTSDLFLATVAALELLDGKSPQDFDQTPASQYILPLLRNENSPLAVKRVAIRLADPSDEAAKNLLLSWVNHDDDALRREVLMSMGEVADEGFANVLMETALDDEQESDARAIAIDSLATQLTADGAGSRVRDLLCSLAGDQQEGLEIRRSAIRSLRNIAVSDVDVQSMLESMQKSFDEEVSVALEPADDDLSDEEETGLVLRLASFTTFDDDNPDRGERVFFHTMGPGCYRCHTVNGRGGSIGPDLSNIGRGMSLSKMIDSILNPSREVAPQFTNWQMATTGGDIHTGMIVLENEGKTAIGNAEGKIIELQTIDIEMRIPQPISVMPERLEQRMTLQEFRDLLAYLQSLGVE